MEWPDLDQRYRVVGVASDCVARWHRCGRWARNRPLARPATLSGNRFGITDTTVWPRAGYKGGFMSQALVDMAFVLEREDGRVFFVSAGYNDPTGLVHTATTRSYLDPLFACLGSAAPGSCGS